MIHLHACPYTSVNRLRTEISSVSIHAFQCITYLENIATHVVSVWSKPTRRVESICIISKDRLVKLDNRCIYTYSGCFGDPMSLDITTTFGGVSWERQRCTRVDAHAFLDACAQIRKFDGFVIGDERGAEETIPSALIDLPGESIVHIAAFYDMVQSPGDEDGRGIASSEAGKVSEK